VISVQVTCLVLEFVDLGALASQRFSGELGIVILVFLGLAGGYIFLG
jgi:hypothetical protein